MEIKVKLEMKIIEFRIYSCEGEAIYDRPPPF